MTFGNNCMRQEQITPESRISGASPFGAQAAYTQTISKKRSTTVMKRLRRIAFGEHFALRKIKVTASAPGWHKLTVRTRTTYVLPPKRPLIDQGGEPNRKRGQ